MKSITKKIPIAVISLLILTFSSCYYDNADELYPLAGYDNACDTAGTISYSQTVSTIFKSNCVNCHNNTNSSGNVVLDNYNGVINSVNSGKLVPAINQTGPKAMPPNGGKLSVCKIRQIELWIEQGSQNN